MFFRLLRYLRELFVPKEKELSPEEQIVAHLRVLRVASVGQLSGALASAILAKKTLDTTRIVEIPFPAPQLEADAVLDDEGRAHLMAYVRELKRFQQMCVREETNLTLAVARGLDTWIATLSAVATPGQFDRGREIWQLLIRGEADIESAYRFMTRRAPTEVELAYMTYRPALLLRR